MVTTVAYLIITKEYSYINLSIDSYISYAMLPLWSALGILQTLQYLWHYFQQHKTFHVPSKYQPHMH